MAPSAENATMLLSPGKRTLVFAVNYEASLYTTVAPSPCRLEKKASSSSVDLVEDSTRIDSTLSNNRATPSQTLENNSTSKDDVQCPNGQTSIIPEEVDKTTKPADETTVEAPSTESKSKSVTINTLETEKQRRSARELKKRQVPMEKSRVRYDMEMVPSVKRNRAFLDRFPLWMTPSTTREEKVRALIHQQAEVLREKQQHILQQQPPQQAQQQPKAEDIDVAGKDFTTCKPCEVNKSGAESVADQAMTPFAEDSSVIWVPKKRTEWEDSVLEMTAVCTSASLRRHFATSGRSTSSKPFHAPLSKEYIRDRVDIDDPLNGYQVRHKQGGWLQGFILWTNFTTWTHYFKWDSTHAMSGIPTMNLAPTAKVDTDGSLALELEKVPRCGDPFEGGVVFQGVAEISLVGGLGCGEYLLRMALDSIRSKRKYKFVVLQATDSSKTFYERFGFVRVGAICRYERRDKDGVKNALRPDTPIMGYRHWTHPNESDSSLQKHGGPSYMMCLKLPEDDENEPIETPFLDEMMKLEVEEKPTIEQVGGSSTPYPKQRRNSSLDSPSSVTTLDSQMPKSGAKRRNSKGRRGSAGGYSASPFASNLPVDAQNLPMVPILRGANPSNNPTRNIGFPAVAGVAKTKPNGQVGGIKRSASVDKDGSAKKRRLSGGMAQQGMIADATPSKNGQGGIARNLIPPTATPAPKKKIKRPPTGQKATPATKTPAAPPVPHRPNYMKQKVKSYPRDRVHYYNKVVRPVKGNKTENYFVLHYDEPNGTIRIIPMEARGVLSGKRAGRPRFQAIMENVERDMRTVPSADYKIVDAFMVMKTPVVASEAWDVLDAN